MRIFGKLAAARRTGAKAKQSEQKLPSPPCIDDVAFWYIINRCNALTVSNPGYYNELWSLLSNVDDAGVAGFAVKVGQIKRLLRSWDNWAAANLIFPGFQQEAHDGFQNWIISSGKETCLRAVEHADNIAEAIHAAGHRELVFADFDKVAAEILSQRSGCEQLLAAIKKDSTETIFPGEHWKLTEQNFEVRLPKLSAMILQDTNSSGEAKHQILH